MRLADRGGGGHELEVVEDHVPHVKLRMTASFIERDI